jgi:hypothetical protein
VLSPQQWLENPKESLAVLQKFRPFLGWMFQIAQQTESRTARAYQDGRWVDQDPVISGLEAPLPQGGLVTAYPYGSYDPLFGSLPDHPSRARPVQVWLGPFPPQLQYLFREQALSVAAGDADPTTAMNSFYETVGIDPDQWLTVRDDFVAFPPQWVTAVGSKGRRAARYSCWMTPAMWNKRNARLWNSAPLAVAVLGVLRSEVQERGVLHAETAFETLSFFDEVAAMLPEAPPGGRLIGESFEWLE